MGLVKKNLSWISKVKPRNKVLLPYLLQFDTFDLVVPETLKMMKLSFQRQF